MHMWDTYNMQETNIFENGFLTGFQERTEQSRDQRRQWLYNDFSNRSLPGEVATPILDAAFGARGSIPALSSGSGYKSSSFITNLQQGTAASMASTIAGNTNLLLPHGWQQFWAVHR